MQDAAYSGPASPTNPLPLDWDDDDDLLKPSKMDSSQYTSPAQSPAPLHWCNNSLAVGQPVPESPSQVVRALGFDGPTPALDLPPRNWQAGASDVQSFSPYAPTHSARSSGGSRSRGESVGRNQRISSDRGSLELPEPSNDSKPAASR